MKPFKGKVAVHAITWGQDYLKGFEEAAQLGYQAIEPWATFVLQFENRENELKETLERYGLTIAGVYGGASGVANRRFADPSKRQEIIDYNVRLARLMSKCGAEHIVCGPGAPRAGTATAEETRQAAATINEVAKRTMEFGVKSCVHPHLWTELQDEAELDAMMELCSPEVYFAPDTAHLTGADMNVGDVIRRYKERVAYVHLKDLTSKAATREHFPMLLGNETLPFFCELGLGTIDFQPIIEALCDIDYTGWLTVEIDESTSTPYNSLEICRDFVQNKLSISIDI